MRLWVTRTLPGNRRTVAALRALGHDVVDVPVLQVQPVSSPSLSDSPDAIVFTSENGVRLHPRSDELLPVPVFAVGDRTADAASSFGYLDVRSAGGAIDDLRRLLLGALPATSRIVHFGASELAGDLAGALRNAGHVVDRRIVYTAEVVSLRGLIGVRRELPSIHGILVHSPRAAERVAKVLAGTGWAGKIWCLSEACAVRLADVADVRTFFPSWPCDAELIRMVREDGVVRLPRRRPPCVKQLRVGSAVRAFRRSAANDNRLHPGDGASDGGPSGEI